MSALTPREAIIDTVLRLLQSLDDNDASLFASTLTTDVVVDMTGISVISGKPMPVLEGIQMATVGLLERGVGNMDTGHMASNFRVNMKEKGLAELSAIAIASHYRKGEGSMAGKVGLTASNRYKMDLVDEGNGVWKIRRAEIKNLWCEGDVSVFGH